MPRDPSTLVGHVIDVQGSAFCAILVEDEQGSAPTVTIGDEDIVVGQVGSYLVVRQGHCETIAIVTRMVEHEKLPPALPGEKGSEVLPLSYAQRLVWLVPAGSLTETGDFERGVSVFPTTGAEVHAMGLSDITRMFAAYQRKGYSVGTLSSPPELDVCLDPTSLFGRHFAVLGQTGAGKSWAVATIVQRALSIMPRAHIVILDPHGEYCWRSPSGARCSAFADGVVRHVDARELEIPYWLMTFSELCDLMIDRSEWSAHNQIAAFRDAVADLRHAEGQRPELNLERTSVDTPVFFSLEQLRAIIEDKNGLVQSRSSGKPIKGPLTGAFDNFLMRLDSRLNDVRYEFLYRPKVRTSSGSLSGLLRDFVGLGDPKRPVTVVDLSSVPFDVRPTVTAQIGRLAFEFNYWNPLYREFPILLICEEAHAYIPRDPSSQFAGSRKSMERIAKEGRKYGVGIGIVSQRPQEVSETVLSQCGTFFCLRITNPGDQAYVRSLLPEAERDLTNTVAGLRRGEAVVLGEAVPLPLRLRLYPPKPQPHSEDVDFYASWRLGPEDIDVNAIVRHWRRQERPFR